MHKTVQEYLAAKYLATRTHSERMTVLKDRCVSPRTWDMVLLFLSGLLGSEAGDARDDELRDLYRDIISKLVQVDGSDHQMSHLGLGTFPLLHKAYKAGWDEPVG
jgi:hypothetical protein